MGRKLKRLFTALFALNVAVGVVLIALKRNITSYGDEDSDELALAAIMDGLTLKSRAGDFRGGSVLTVAGGTDIDLRDATLAPGGGALRLRTVMGGTELVVPEDWHVEVNGHGILGSCEDRTTGGEEPGEDAPKLYVDAWAVMGGIEVVRRPAEVPELDIEAGIEIFPPEGAPGTV